MRPLALFLALALPLSAQVVSDEFPDPTEPFSDRASRELADRHRPFLSGLYAQSAFAVGPEIGRPDLIGAAAVEGGYRFDSGHAIALATSLRSPLSSDPLTGEPDLDLTASIEGEFVASLGRGADRRSVLRGAEVGLGAGASVFALPSGVSVFAPTVSLSPRVVFPLTPTTGIPVGLRISQEIGSEARTGPYVGVSVGFRRIWADAARRILE